MSHYMPLITILFSTAAALVFITSPSTPFDLSAFLHSSLTFKYRVLTAIEYFNEVSFEDNLILDYSFDSQVTVALPEPNTIVMWPSRVRRSFTLYPNNYELRFTEYIRAMNFTKVTVVSDDERINLVRDFPDVYMDLIFFPRDISLKSTTELVRKIIKPSGSTIYAIFLQARTTLYFLQALEIAKLNKAGFVFILSEVSSYYRGLCKDCRNLSATGALCIVPAFSADAMNQEEVQAAVLRSIFLSEMSSPSSVLEIIDSSLVVINIVNSRSVVVARDILQAKIIIGVLPGGLKALPKISKLSIPVSINYMTYTDGSNIPVSGPTMRGYEVAFEEKNNSTSLLPNFDLDVQPVDLQGYTYNLTLVEDLIIKNRNRLGLAHFPIPTSVYIQMVYSIFNNLNISVAMSTTYSDIALSKPADYPLLVCVLTSSDYYGFVTMRVIARYGWKRLALIYGAGGDPGAMYPPFVKYAKAFGITFTNSEASRCLNESLTMGATAELNATLIEIMQSSARIILLAHIDPGTVFEAMYDLGIRNEYLLLINMAPTRSTLKSIQPNMKKRLVVANGALVINPRAFLGTVGQKVYRELIAKDGLDTYEYGCFFYDSVMLYFHAIEYMLSQGLDYEDAFEMAKAMRGTHFAGCGGIVYIAPDSNMKPDAEFAIKNFRYYEGNQSIEIEDVLYFNPFSSILLKDVAPIVWPDGTYNYWNDTLNLPCPFRDSEVHVSVEGLAICVSVSLGILLLVLISSWFSWRAWRTVHYEMLSVRVELSWEDVVQMIAVPLEAVQVAVVGLESLHLNAKISQVAELANLQFSIFIGASGEIFWRMLNLIFGVVGLYTVICVLMLTGLDRMMKWMPVLPFLFLFVKLLFPAASTLLFIPVVSVLSQLFQCQEAAGPSHTDTFMERDCNTWCWQGSHLLFAVAAAIALFMFIPILVFPKPWWQHDSEVQHIKLHVVSHVFKSVFHAVLVLIRNLLKKKFEIAHGAVYLLILVAHIAYMIKFPLYNYNRYLTYRINLWATISMLITFIFSVLVLAARLVPSSRITSLYVFYISTGVLLVAGLLLQRFVSKFNSYLFRKKIDQTNLFKFAFTFGSRALRYLPARNQEELPNPTRSVLVEGTITDTKTN